MRGMMMTELKVTSTPKPTITVNSVTLMRAFQNGRPRVMPYERFSAERTACMPDEPVHSVTIRPTVSSAWLRWASTCRITGSMASRTTWGA